ERLAAAEAARTAAERRIADLERDLAAAVVAAADLAGQRDRLATENGRLAGETERLAAAVDRARAQNTELASLVRESHVAAARLDAESSRLQAHNALLTERVGALEGDLVALQSEQADLLDRLRDRADRHVAGLEGGLQLTRLDLDTLLERLRREEAAQRVAAVAEGITPAAALGGPMIPGLPEEDVLPETMPPAAIDLVALFDRSAELTELAERLPLAVPLLDDYQFTSGFGTRNDPFTGRRSSHFGLDFAAPRRTPIYAPASGTVTFAGRRGAYGNLVEVDHGLGISTLYAHLHEISVEVGDRIMPGDALGLLGSTGRSTGPHLHYEILIDDQPVNPMNFVRAGQHVLEVADPQQRQQP
ncbi:MAG: peptidoglycan DD-metalloendopeptidase family protein, partial [Alphaproteobacteria bacterium]|nr:peptidoglycan DD-metalloendopeptidase family protein [Alphaproteobacteria bacterium]